MPRQPGSRIRDFDHEPHTNRYGPKSVEPHSEWQLLIEKTREEKKLPLRDVSTRAQIPLGTLYNWVRSKRGVPSRPYYSQQVNKRLAKALGVNEEELATAYNNSAFKPVDPKVLEPDPDPAPQSLKEPSTAFTVDGLRRLIHMLKASGKTSFTLAEIEFTASMIPGFLPPE